MATTLAESLSQSSRSRRIRTPVSYWDSIYGRDTTVNGERIFNAIYDTSVSDALSGLEAVDGVTFDRETRRDQIKREGFPVISAA